MEDALVQQSYRRNEGATATAGRRGSAEMNLFEPYLSQWGLDVDGEPVITATSRLLPVCHRDLPGDVDDQHERRGTRWRARPGLVERGRRRTRARD